MQICILKSKRIRLCVILVNFHLLASSQSLIQSDNAILVRNSPERAHTIEVKWYDEEVIAPFGVHVFRRKVGFQEWNQLTDRPLILNRDTSGLSEIDKMMLEASEDILSDNEEWLKINLLIQSFLSNQLSQRLGIFFKDTTVVASESYEYAVFRLKSDHSMNKIGQSKAIKVQDYTPSAQVEQLTFTKEHKMINLNWSVNLQEHFAYDLFISVKDSLFDHKLNDKPILLSKQRDDKGIMRYPDPKYRINTLQDDLKYEIYVKGIDYFGSYSKASDTLQIIIKDVTPPTPPGPLQIKIDSMNLEIEWTPSFDPNLMGYRLMKSKSSDGPFHPVTPQPIEDTMYRYHEYIPGHYYLYAEAIDQAGNSSRSRTELIEVQDIVPPAPPSNIEAKLTDRVISLSWDAGKEGDMMGYRIFRGINGQPVKNYKLLNSFPVTLDQYTDTVGIYHFDKFSYYVVAVDTNYNISIPSTRVSLKKPDNLPPQPPEILESRCMEKILKARVEYFDSDLKSFVLYREKDGQHEEIKELPPSTSLSINIAEMEGSSFYISAVDSAGNESRFSTKIKPYCLKKQSVGEVQKINYTVKMKKRKNALQITWENINREDLRGYIIEKGQSKHNLRVATGLLVNSNYYDADYQSFYRITAYGARGKIAESNIIKVRSLE